MWRGHRCAGQILIGLAGNRREDVHARRGEVNRRGTEIGERGEIVVVVGRRNGNHVRRVVRRRAVAGWIPWDRIVIRRVVARRRDEQHVLRVRFVDLVEQPLREAAVGPAVREYADVGARCGGGLDDELDRVDRVGGRPRAVGVEEFRRHDAGSPIDTRHAEVVVANRADRARHVRAVAVVIVGIARLQDRVEAVRTGRAGDGLAANRDVERERRGPDVRRQIRVSVIDTRVDNGDHVGARSRRHVPGQRRADVGAECSRFPDGLADVAQPPQFAEPGIDGQRIRHHDVVRLYVRDIRVILEEREQR